MDIHIFHFARRFLILIARQNATPLIRGMEMSILGSMTMRFIHLCWITKKNIMNLFQPYFECISMRLLKLSLTVQ